MKLKKWVRRKEYDVSIENRGMFFIDINVKKLKKQPDQYFNSVTEQYNDAWDNIQYILELRKERLKPHNIGIGITPTGILDVRGTNIEKEVFI